MPVPAERRRNRVRLTVSALQAASDPVEDVLVGPVLPGALTGAVAALAAALVGWLALTGLVLAVWFTVMAMPLGSVLQFSGTFWLAAHGGGAVIGDRVVTLVPLGLTLLLVLLVRAAAATAIRRVLSAGEPDEPERPRLIWQTAGALVVSYTAVAGLVSLASGASSRLGWELLGAFAVAALGATWAAAEAGGAAVLRLLPGWLPPMLRAAGGGLAVLAAGGAVVLLTGLVLGVDRVAMIEQADGLDVVGQVVWFLVMLGYLPTLIAWAASFALGAGFTVGAGSVVSPWLTQVGILPAIPVLGALPTSGPGTPWSYGWLVIGSGAGAVAGLLQARVDSGTLGRRIGRAALAGLLVTVGFLALAAASTGDLGVQRLVGLGPRLLFLLWFAPGQLIGGAALAALVHWFVVARRAQPDAPAGEDTTVALDETELDTVQLGG